MGVNYRKVHTLHGAGHGRDVVIQGGQLYDRAGDNLPGDLNKITERGIPVTNEVAVHLSTREAEAEITERKKKLDEYLRKVRAEAEEKLKNGEPLTDEDGVANLKGLDGLDDLVADLEAKQQSRVRKKK